MKILILSIHPLIDNRIGKHIKTLLENKYIVEYANVSISNSFKFQFKDNVKLMHLNKNFDTHNPISAIHAYLYFKRCIKLSSSDVVHIHDIFLLPLVPYIKKMNKKVIFDKHETFEKIDSTLTKLFTRYEKRISKKIDGIIYTAQQQEEFIKLAEYKHYEHVPNYQLKSDYGEVEENKIEEDKIRIIYIGSLSEKDRNILLMLETIDKIMYKNSKVECIIGGKVFHDSVRQKLEFLEKKYTEKFRYMGVVDYKEVVRLNKSSDIGLLFFKDDPNTYNSSSNKLYEYLLGGQIFIGVGKFILGNEIRLNNAGKIFDFNTTADEITDYILTMIKDKKELEIMKENSRRLGNMYTWESIENRYINLYNKIIIRKEI